MKVFYDKRITEKNLSSCCYIIDVHNKCGADADMKEARSYYEKMCDEIVSEQWGRKMCFMDMVCQTVDFLKIANNWSSQADLTRVNKCLYSIKPLTNKPIVLFPAVESR